MKFPGGPVMRARREELGIPRSALATATTRGEEMVRRWERGDNVPPRDVLVKIAHALDVPVAVLSENE